MPTFLSFSNVEYRQLQKRLFALASLCVVLVNPNFLGKTNRARTSEKGAAGWEEEDSASHNLADLLLGICLTSAFQTTCIESAFFSSDILGFAQWHWQELRFVGVSFIMEEPTGQKDISRIDVQVHILQIQRFQHEWLQGRVGNVVKLLQQPFAK